MSAACERERVRRCGYENLCLWAFMTRCAKATWVASRIGRDQNNDQSQSEVDGFRLWRQPVRTKATSVASHSRLAQRGGRAKVEVDSINIPSGSAMERSEYEDLWKAISRLRRAWLFGGSPVTP